MEEEREREGLDPGPEHLAKYYDLWFRKIDERFAAVGYSPSDRFNEIAKQRIVSRHVMDVLRHAESGTWLDYGCGRAYPFKDHDLPAEFRCIGVDIAEDVIRRNRVEFGGFENVQFYELRSGILDQLAEESVDLVTMLEVIEHVYGVEAVVANLVGSLKVGGVIVITTPNRFRAASLMRSLLPASWSRYLEDRTGALGIDELECGDEELSAFEVRTHFHEFTMTELRTLLQGAGLEVISAQRTALKVMPNRSFNLLASKWSGFVDRFADLDYRTRNLPIGFFKMGMVVVARKAGSAR